jgi:putative DNA primase/helicase
MNEIVFPDGSQRPTFACYDEDFFVGNKRFKAGVYYHEVKQKKDKDRNVVAVLLDDRWICSVLKVICIVRTGVGKDHSYLIEYIPHGEKAPRREILSQAQLLGRPEEPLKALRSLGVSILHTNARLVREYLDREHLRFSKKTPNDFWRSEKTVGWAPAPACFILPGETLGQHSGVWFSGKCDGSIYSKSGSLDDWKNNIAALCEKNPFPSFAVSSAFAGPLLELFNVPGIGSHLYGDSTNGKSTTLVGAVSVWGPPSFLLSWRSTVNGLEIQAAARSSTVLVLDESHMIPPKDLDAGIYLLANGVAKSRMTKEIVPRELSRWRVCVLSSGERSIESHLAAMKIDHKVGQGIRIADVPVTGSYGIFEDLHGCTDGAAFADKLRGAAAQYYGVAGPLFVERLIKEVSSGLSLPTRLDEIMPRFGDDLNAQETRVARGFGIAALAGELAIEWGIVPWKKEEALNSAIAVFGRWRAAQPRSPKGKEHAQIAELITDFVDKHGNSRFCDLHSVDPDRFTVRDQAGYWEDTIHGRIYLFTSGGLKDASGNFDTARVIKAIEAAGAFVVVGEDGRKSKYRTIPRGTPGGEGEGKGEGEGATCPEPKGDRRRLYHIDIEKLRGDQA